MYNVEIYDETDFILQYPKIYKYFTDRINSVSDISKFEFCQFLVMDSVGEIAYENISTEEVAGLEFEIDEEGNVLKEYNFSIDLD